MTRKCDERWKSGEGGVLVEEIIGLLHGLQDTCM